MVCKGTPPVLTAPHPEHPRQALGCSLSGRSHGGPLRLLGACVRLEPAQPAFSARTAKGFPRRAPLNPQQPREVACSCPHVRMKKIRFREVK